MSQLKTYTLEITSKDQYNKVLETCCISLSSTSLMHNRCENVLDINLDNEYEVECVGEQVKEQLTEILRKVLK